MPDFILERGDRVEFIGSQSVVPFVQKQATLGMLGTYWTRYYDGYGYVVRVKWDNGSSFVVLDGIDKIRKVEDDA